MLSVERMSTRNNHSCWMIQHIFLLILLFTPSLLCVNPPLPIHQLPIVMRQCVDVVSTVQNSTAEFTSDDFREFPLLSNNSSRFTMDYWDVNGLLLSRYGTCMVPGLTKFLTCSFVFFEDGEKVRIYNLSISTPSTGCPKDTRTMIKVWDTVEEQELLIDFGISCCIYERDEDEEKRLPKLFSWVSMILFAGLALLMVVLKIVGVVFAKKNRIIVVRPIGPWVGGRRSMAA